MATNREHPENARWTDRQLLTRFVARRDEAAFRALVTRHGPLVLGVCRRVLGDMHEADDAFQATFLVLARSAGTIRRHRSLASWLHSVAYRIASRLAKEKWRHMEPLPRDMTEDGIEVFDQIAQRDEQRLVDEELNRLPEKDRHALTLRYLQELSNEEIADTLAISVSAVESRVRRAKERLRRRLTRRGVSLSVFVAAVTRSQVEAQPVEALITETVQLVMSGDTAGVATNSAAHDLALSEIGEMAMSIKRAFLVVALAIVAITVGLYGLSKAVVAEEPKKKATVMTRAPQDEPVAEPLFTAASDAKPSAEVESDKRLDARAGADATLQLDNAIALIRSHEENLVSFTLEYLCDERAFPFVDSSKEIITQRRYRYLGAGAKRRLEETMLTERSAAQSEPRCIYTFNGEREFQYWPELKQGSVGSIRGMPADYYDHLHGYSTGLAALLAENRNSILRSGIKVTDDSLLALAWRDNDYDQEIRLWLDPAAGYQLRRLKTIGQPQDSNTSRGLMTYMRETRVLDYVRKESWFFPSEFVTLWEKAYENGDHRLANEMHVRLLRAEPNVEHHPSVFEIEFPDGTQLMDTDTRLISIVGKPGSSRPAPPAGEETQPRIPDEARWWSAWHVAAAVFTVMLCVVVTALWFRRER